MLSRLSPLVLIILGGCVTPPSPPNPQPLRPTEKVLEAMELLYRVQQDSRKKDPDRNGLEDYWIGDVAGLYSLDSGEGPIKLITKSLADADARPVTPRYATVKIPVPLDGYLFKAIEVYQTSPLRYQGYDDSVHRNLYKFGFCAFPASGSGPTLILNEDGLLWSKHLASAEVTIYPRDPILAGWKSIAALGKARPPSTVDPVVYTAPIGFKHHAASCPSLGQSYFPIRVSEARKRSLTPCSRCR